MYRNLDEVFQLAKTKGRKRIAIAAAHDAETIKAAIMGYDEQLFTPILIGEKERIETIIQGLDRNISEFEIIDSQNNNESAQIAVSLVKAKKADLLMKGHLETAEMIRAVVKKETGIAIKETISHINLMEIEKYDKLVIMTDVAISINPTLEQKKDILENAVSVFHALGYEKPKVAAVCAIEKINPKMPETVEGKELKDLNEAGIIKNCIVEGPISFDIAMDKGRATRKHFEGKIQGDADILLMPNLLAGNLLSKGISIFGEAKAVGFVMGAEVPIVLTSRGALAKAKYQSMLACLAIV